MTAVLKATLSLALGLGLAALPGCEEEKPPEPTPTEVGDVCGGEDDDSCDKEFFCLVLDGAGTCQLTPNGCEDGCDCIDLEATCPDSVSRACISIFDRATVDCQGAAEGEGEGE
jgi:hypothetical protein